MKANRKSIGNDSAVSPVIGVMLMIVVTVILAAAVSSFAGSVQTKDDPTSAVFDVACSESDGIITIKHMGGDVIYKEDIKIMISHGIPKMTGYLSNENLTFYPAEQENRGDGMDKIALQPGQTATYKFDFDTNSDGEKVPVLGQQWIYVGETFEIAIIDVNTENTVFSTNIVMEP
ncbi:type IV pilin N-terminal domain-containing protein [Methanolobus sp. WCC1]|jgi:flagellin-like protein|uniref:type IV pilin N-terminal domain-containing protein n=1 Tax=unclassified Methanolobus TaxID=2629569 RepID=UPI0025912913|nr:type IV pilin N-terminal domain-containing protein [Methanolobus sp.]MDK2830427.1 archaeal type pilus assembly protein PilA [Methanolobus sp.]